MPKFGHFQPFWVKLRKFSVSLRGQISKALKHTQYGTQIEALDEVVPKK